MQYKAIIRFWSSGLPEMSWEFSAPSDKFAQDYIERQGKFLGRHLPDLQTIGCVRPDGSAVAMFEVSHNVEVRKME